MESRIVRSHRCLLLAGFSHTERRDEAPSVRARLQLTPLSRRPKGGAFVYSAAGRRQSSCGGGGALRGFSGGAGGGFGVPGGGGQKFERGLMWVAAGAALA